MSTYQSHAHHQSQSHSNGYPSTDAVSYAHNQSQGHWQKLNSHSLSLGNFAPHSASTSPTCYGHKMHLDSRQNQVQSVAKGTLTVGTKNGKKSQYYNQNKNNNFGNSDKQKNYPISKHINNYTPTNGNGNSRNNIIRNSNNDNNQNINTSNIATTNDHSRNSKINIISPMQMPTTSIAQDSQVLENSNSNNVYIIPKSPSKYKNFLNGYQPSGGHCSHSNANTSIKIDHVATQNDKSISNSSNLLKSTKALEYLKNRSPSHHNFYTISAVETPYSANVKNINNSNTNTNTNTNGTMAGNKGKGNIFRRRNSDLAEQDINASNIALVSKYSENTKYTTNQFTDKDQNAYGKNNANFSKYAKSGANSTNMNFNNFSGAYNKNLQDKSFYQNQTEKTIKNNCQMQQQYKKQLLYETSSTMKDIENTAQAKNAVLKQGQTPTRKAKISISTSLLLQPQVSSFRLEPFSQHIQIIRQLGKGKYGSVYLAVQTRTNFLFALKVIPKSTILQSNLLQQFVRQLKIQFYLSHPGIVGLYGFFADVQNFYLIMEYGSDGQLYEKVKMQDNITVSEQTAGYVANNLLEVVAYMHSHNVIHRDIKPENIVLVLGNIKICDFGWAVHANAQMRTTFCGTPLYFSPQLLSGGEYDEKVDLWSVGILIYQLLYAKSPFNLKRPQDLPKIVTDQIYFPKSSYSSEYKQISQQCKNFLRRILNKNPNFRPTAQQLLSDPFVRRHKGIQVCQQFCGSNKGKSKSKQSEERFYGKRP